jgi:hypothetical protein
MGRNEGRHVGAQFTFTYACTSRVLVDPGTRSRGLIVSIVNFNKKHHAVEAIHRKQVFFPRYLSVPR